MSAIHTGRFFDELKGFENKLRRKRIEKRYVVHQFVKDRLTFAGILMLTIASVLTLYLSNAPYTFFKEDDSLLIFSFKHSGRPSKIKKALRDEELSKLPAHMRVKADIVIRRFSVYADIYIDGNKVFSKGFRPAGLWQNGASYAFEKIIVKPGIHNMIINLSETNNPEMIDFRYKDTIDFKPGMAIALDFDEKKKRFYIAK